MKNINICLIIIYFIIINCFKEKYSLVKSFIEVNHNKHLIWGKTCCKITIMKLYSLLKKKQCIDYGTIIKREAIYLLMVIQFFKLMRVKL